MGANYNKKISHILANFSEEDKAVFTTKEFTGSFKLPVLIKKLRNLGLYDLYAEQKRRSYVRWAITVAAIAGVIIPIVFTSFMLSLIYFITFLLALWTSFFLGILSMVLREKSKTFKGQDIKNEFREFLVPVFVALGEDIMPHSKIFIRTVVDDPFHGKYLIGDKPPDADFFKEVFTPQKLDKSVYKYHQNWITASMVFVDQVRLSIEIERHGSKTSTTKVRKSGKVWTKVKDKMRILVQLRMLVPKSHYRKSERIVSSDDLDYSMQTKLEDKTEHFLVKAKYKRKGSPSDHLTIREFLGLIRTMYSSFQPI